jgi:hypothetical protein
MQVIARAAPVRRGAAYESLVEAYGENVAAWLQADDVPIVEGHIPPECETITPTACGTATASLHLLEDEAYTVSSRHRQREQQQQQQQRLISALRAGDIGNPAHRLSVGDSHVVQAAVQADAAHPGSFESRSAHPGSDSEEMMYSVLCVQPSHSTHILTNFGKQDRKQCVSCSFFLKRAPAFKRRLQFQVIVLVFFINLSILPNHFCAALATVPLRRRSHLTSYTLDSNPHTQQPQSHGSGSRFLHLCHQVALMPRGIGIGLRQAHCLPASSTLHCNGASSCRGCGTCLAALFGCAIVSRGTRIQVGRPLLLQSGHTGLLACILHIYVLYAVLRCVRRYKRGSIANTCSCDMNWANDVECRDQGAEGCSDPEVQRRCRKCRMVQYVLSQGCQLIPSPLPFWIALLTENALHLTTMAIHSSCNSLHPQPVTDRAPPGARHSCPGLSSRRLIALHARNTYCGGGFVVWPHAVHVRFHAVHVRYAVHGRFHHVPVPPVMPCCSQIWRVYLKGIERWLADLLQPTFDGLVAAGSVPRFVQRLRIVEFTLDHQAPVFSDMRRRTSRKVHHFPSRADLGGFM